MEKFSIRKIIFYSINKGLKIPSHCSIEDFIHEVGIFVWKNCDPEKLTTASVIQCAYWVRCHLCEEYVRYRKNLPTKQLFDTHINHDFGDSRIDAKHLVQNILRLSLTNQEKELLKLLAEGLDSVEIRAKMGLHSRQRYEQIKRMAFDKVRGMYGQFSENF